MKFFPDVLAITGLALLGYGLFLFAPWVSFSVCGAILLFAAYLLGAHELANKKDGSR